MSLALTSLDARVVDLCNGCSISSLEEALTLASDHDTILIRPSTFSAENILIKKPVTIIGIGDVIFISKTGDEILTIMSDSVTISGLTLKGVTTSYLKERSAIRVLNKDYFQIVNNRIISCFFGIYLEKANKGLVSNNIISTTSLTEAESGNGIHAWSSNELLISDNTISGHRDGIYFEFVNKSKITGNRSESNLRYGLHFMFSNDDDYMNNTFFKNGVGVAVMFSRRIKMYENEFSYNWGRSSYGLLLKEIYDADIAGNNFEQNTIAIFVEGSNRIKYYNNVFKRNGWGIKFSGGCEDNEITQNNFINNSLDLIVNTKLSSNVLHHNYWSYYSGYDLNKDGIGDIPHYPVKLFSYVLDKVPEAIVLMRSFFVDIINFSERVSPVFTPKEVADHFPLMALRR